MLLTKVRLLNKVTGQKLADIIKLLQFWWFRVFFKKLAAVLEEMQRGGGSS